MKVPRETANPSRLSGWAPVRRCRWVLLVTLAAAVPAGAVPAKLGTSLARYTSGGHVLGFTAGRYHVSNGAYALRVDLLGSGPVEPVGEGGESEPAGTAAPLGRVTYAGAWKGIDVVYDAPGSRAGGIVRSTWHLAPGADPGAIRLRYNRPVRLNDDGTLTVEAGGTGRLVETAPVAWQEVAGERRAVEVRFACFGKSEVGFVLGAYDRTAPLVIDPTLQWSTFLGGSGYDGAYGVAVDGGGNVYVVGESGASWGSPVRAFTPGGDDAFVAKLDASGTLEWNTFLGGSALDFALGVAVDGNGDVHVAGQSRDAWGAPVRAFTPGSGADAFVAKLDASGTLEWHAFLGGSAFDGASSVVVDGVGNAYVAGTSQATWGSPARVHTAGQDAFAALLDPGGTLLWNTFLGGVSLNDRGQGIGVDATGGVYVAGESDVSWGSPLRAFTPAPNSDAFVAKLDDATGALQWSTFLGGSGFDVARGIAVDGGGNVFVAGSSAATWGSPLLVYTSGSDTFVARLDAAGGLQWNTFLGGYGSDSGSGVAVDGSGSLHVTGTSDATWGNPERAYTGSRDAFVAHLDAGGALQWSTFLGGAGGDYAGDVAVDGSGNVYVTGESDASWGSPVRAFAADSDAFVATIGQASAPPPPPPGTGAITSTQYPNFRFWVRISDTRLGTAVAGCLPETVCVAGAIPTRAEAFLRIVGPKGNGYLWPNVVKFNTTKTEVWIEQVSTGAIRYYLLPALTPESSTLPGLVDKMGFLP